MAVRTAAGAVLLAMTVFIIFIAPSWVLPIAISIVSAIAVYEMLHSTGFVKSKRLIIYSIIMALLIPMWAFLDKIPELATAGLFLFVFLLLIDCLTEPRNTALEVISGVFLTATVIPLFLSSLVDLYFMENGRFLVSIPIIAAYSSDVFAYLVGSKFGKRKLCPDISPNKTIEGSLGSLILTPLILLLSGLILHHVFYFRVNYIAMILYGIAGSFAGQIGDLSFSYVKRRFGIKDFGKLIPGHGGVLDRFDSMLLVAPLIGLLIVIFPAVSAM